MLKKFIEYKNKRINSIVMAAVMTFVVVSVVLNHNAQAATYTNADRSGFLRQGTPINYNQPTLVGQIWADWGQEIVSFNVPVFGVTDLSNGSYPMGQLSAYGPYGSMEFQIKDDSGNVVYDYVYQTYPSGWKPREIKSNPNSIVLSRPTTRLDFYVINNIYQQYWGSPPSYYTYYPLLTDDNFGTPVNVNDATITEGDQVALQTLSSAQNAQTAAQQAQQTSQQAATAATNVNTIVNSTLTVTGGVVQDQQGTVLQAARAAQQLAQSANNKLDSVQNTLTQMQSNQLTIQNFNQYLPATLNHISGLNGATATSSGSLQVVLDSTNATQYRYRIDSGGWSGWMPIANLVSVPIPKGVHTLTIQAANGPVGTPGPVSSASMQVIGL